MLVGVPNQVSNLLVGKNPLHVPILDFLVKQVTTTLFDELALATSRDTNPVEVTVHVTLQPFALADKHLD